MGSFVNTPNSSDLHAVGKSIKYEYTLNSTNQTYLPALRIEIWINGSFLLTKSHGATKLNGNDYTFEFDISKDLSSYFNYDEYTDVFNSLTTPFHHPIHQLSAIVKVYENIPNQNGVLVESQTSVNSTAINVINSRVELTDYSKSTNRKFLTNEPNGIIVIGTLKYIAIWNDGSVINSVKIKIIDNGGAFREGVIKLTGSNQVAVIGIGSNQIANNDFVIHGNWVALEYFNTIASIQINAGTLTESIVIGPGGEPVYTATYESKSEIRKYKYVNKCNALPLHFINAFGQQDTYCFDDFSYKTKHKTSRYKTSNLVDRKLIGEKSKTVTVKASAILEATFDWLSEIQESESCFIDNELFIVEDSEIEKDNRFSLDHEFTLIKRVQFY